MSNKLKNYWVPFAVLFGLSFAFSLTTHFSPVSNETFGHDAGIFAYIGMALTKGEVLYTGAWDNKGPLLYFLNALGILINYRYGIYLIELCSLFATSVFLYKTALLFVSRFRALICAAFCMLPLFQTLEGGNLSEEYALPFTTLAFYLIAKFFKNDFVLKKYEMLIVGMCIAAVLILRLNILAFLGVAVLGVIIALVAKKEYKILTTVTVFALLGFFLFLAPFVIYLAKTGSLKMCIDTVYLGALGFFSDISLFSRIANVLNMVVDTKSSGALYMVILFVLFFPIGFVKNRANRSSLDVLGIISLFGLLITLIANSLSGAHHMHYFMCFIPVLIIPAVWSIEKIEMLCDKDFWAKAGLKGVSLLVFAVFCVNYYLPAITALYTLSHEKSYNYVADEKYISENSEPTDLVQIIGGTVGVTANYRTNRLSASNYFYYANGRFSDESKVIFADEISNDVIEAKPKLIMFETQEKMDDFLAHLTDRQKWDDLIESEYTVQENDFYHMVYKRNA